MIIKSIELKNFRNYEELNLNLDGGTNILYGDNAQGKTNILESIYVSGTTKSHKGSRDKEMIRFGENVKVDLDELIAPERKADEGSNLWVVFNRIQEKLITGGCSYQMGAKVRKARAVKNFTMDLKINEALWELAEEYVN